MTTGVVHARVTEGPLSLERLAALVGRPAAGAIVTFQGTTRDVEQLEYEAYREMAEERIAAIVAEAVERHGLEAAAAEHRVGTVALGDASVAVAASAAHREEAFAGARRSSTASRPRRRSGRRRSSGNEHWVEGGDPVATSEQGDRAGLRALPSVETLLQTEPLRRRR